MKRVREIYTQGGKGRQILLRVTAVQRSHSQQIKLLNQQIILHIIYHTMMQK